LFVFIGRVSLRAARRFLIAAEREFLKLAAMPGLGGRWETDNPAFADMRVWPISRFKKFLVFYRPVAKGIEVIRVLYSGRDLDTLFG
jgi:toxin ParE1/3/4